MVQFAHGFPPTGECKNGKVSQPAFVSKPQFVGKGNAKLDVYLRSVSKTVILYFRACSHYTEKFGFVFAKN